MADAGAGRRRIETGATRRLPTSAVQMVAAPKEHGNAEATAGGRRRRPPGRVLCRISMVGRRRRERDVASVGKASQTQGWLRLGNAALILAVLLVLVACGGVGESVSSVATQG